jgi:hypothetical protein
MLITYTRINEKVLLLHRLTEVIAVSSYKLSERRQKWKSIRGNYASVSVATLVCVENGYIYLATPSILRTVVPHLYTLTGSMKRRP